MSLNNKSTDRIHRDGTSQADRFLDALDPEYVKVDERSLEDLIQEAQRLSKELRFFDENNEERSNWEAFLVENALEYLKEGETGKAIYRKKWAAQLANFLRNPAEARVNNQNLTSLSRPHVALFLTFLNLLEQVRRSLNQLTEKHLEFYFLERLGLSSRPAIPDEVNVLLQPEEGIDFLEVKAGTLFFGGKDAEGNELHYRADQDTVISQAKISDLQTVFISKLRIGIQEAQLLNNDDEDRGFTKMMSLALGNPGPGDPLPEFPNGISDWEELHAKVEAGDTIARKFLTQSLFFSEREEFSDFRFVMETQKQNMISSLSVKAGDWDKVYRILDQAFKNRFKKQRANLFRTIREDQEEGGLEKLTQHVFGRPAPGDFLPLYKGTVGSLAEVQADLLAPTSNPDPQLQSKTEALRQEAKEYIAEELLLSEKEFVNFMQVSQNSDASAEDWEEVYTTLELADRRIRKIAMPSPVLEEFGNIFAEEDVRSTAFRIYDKEEESPRFKTFGGTQVGIDRTLKPANIGFALSSDLLRLREGKRQVSLYLKTDKTPADIQALLDESQGQYPPFEIYLSGEESWISPDTISFSSGNFVLGNPESSLQGTKDENELSLSGGEQFSEGDLEKVIVWTDGTIYFINELLNPQAARITEIGKLENGASEILMYPKDSAYVNSIRIEIGLREESPEVKPVSLENKRKFLHSDEPVIVFSLKHFAPEEGNSTRTQSSYHAWKNLKINKVYLGVEVEGVRNLVVANEQSNVDPRKSFQPFGGNPEVNSTLYFTNPELSSKKLDSLQLDLEWAKKPGDMADHYANYWKVIADNPDLTAKSFKIRGETDFKGNILLQDRGAEVNLGRVNLFPGEKVGIENVSQAIQTGSPGFSYKPLEYVDSNDEVISWQRYFKVELGQTDFQHTVYEGIFRRQMLSEKSAVRKLEINSPYTPVLKSMKVNYTSHQQFIPAETRIGVPSGLFHIHPFGFAPITGGKEIPFYPVYEAEGELYLGIEKLKVPQILSLLFQVSEGSADPDLERAQLAWSYLRENEWITIDPSRILSDTTSGLIKSGIIQIEVPGDATETNTLMGTGKKWLRVVCEKNTRAIPDSIQISTQALRTTLSSTKVADSHFETPLQADSISETLEFFPGIRKVSQPFTSGKGKPAERAAHFYNRISERLRHKNRALNMWDYERLVLDRFPEVHKVKCLPALNEDGNANKGTVNLLVVPDIKGKLPFNPFEPKVSHGTLSEIQQFLDERSPAFAEVKVSNPSFLQVMVRCVIKFLPGYSESAYRPKLVDELRRFLAPWAYGESESITIGGSIYASVITNFIADRPYIDYVSNLKLFQSEDGQRFTDVRALNDGQNKIVSKSPDTVLVSARNHVIDLVDEGGYDEDDFTGINYLRVELDFEIGENLLSGN